MTPRSIPLELMARRFRALEMYKAGYQILDISRYFEVPTTCITKSLYAMLEFSFEDATEGINTEVCLKNGKIEKELEKRDCLLKGKKLRDVQNKGFWCIPIEFANAKEETNEEVMLQKELRTIGIHPKEICSYMGYGDDPLKIVVSRPQYSSFFEKQKDVAKALCELEWSYKDVVEFCGISMGHLVQHDEEQEKRDKNKMKSYYKIADTAKKIYDDYSNNPKMTHQRLAKKYGVTRRTVITYLKQYQLHNPKAIMVEKKSHGNERKKVKELVLEQLREKYLIKGEDGQFHFGYDELNVRYTIERVAKELGVTEVTVMKYKNRINESNN